MVFLLWLVAWTNLAFVAAVDRHPTTTPTWCNSPIYCEGPLLKTVQMAHLFPDSKSFVDMPTSKPLDEVLASFDQLGTNASREAIQQFVAQHFLKEGTELVQVDTSPPPLSWLDTIDDPKYRAWIDILHHAWSALTFRFDTSSLCEGCVSSTLPVKRPFVVPGGRFREFYYWDSYFVIEGLLLSGLDDLARGMIENFMDFVDTLGFMPNGARIYYLNRSQPPFLTEMVRIYYEKTKDEDFLMRALPTLDKEYAFWMRNTSVAVNDSEGQTHQLNRYIVHNQSPRPESYLEDYQTAYSDGSLNEDQKKNLFADLATGAETGWDYSSRWSRVKTGHGEEVLRALDTRNVVPVELNALLWSMENTLSEWYTASTDRANSTLTRRSLSRKQARQRSRFFRDQARKRLNAMDRILWNAKEASFYDFNLTSQTQNIEFTPAGMYPFWLGAIPERVSQDPDTLRRVFDPVHDALSKYPGLLTTSYYNTSMQWDFPNGWPPLQYITLQAIRRVSAMVGENGKDDSLDALGKTLAQRNAESVFCSWYKTGGSIPTLLQRLPNSSDTGHIFEKFDARFIGESGSGGEYKVQVGFGWTNGVMLWLFRHYGHLASPQCH